jgi:hypothetical protein
MSILNLAAATEVFILDGSLALLLRISDSVALRFFCYGFPIRPYVNFTVKPPASEFSQDHSRQESAHCVNLDLNACLFKKMSIAIVRTVYLAAAKSWMLELLTFDEYCRFDTPAFFIRIK